MYFTTFWMIAYPRHKFAQIVPILSLVEKEKANTKIIATLVISQMNLG